MRISVFTCSYIILITISHVQSRCSQRLQCLCGIKSKGTRIVGGFEATPNSFPWMASLVDLGMAPFCGGVIISTKYILTAAHCLPDVKPNTMRVIMGHHDINKMRNAQVFNVEKFIPHKKYREDDPYQKFDIALLKLTEEVQFNEKIHPVCLPGRFFGNYSNQPFNVAGWGLLGENRPPATRLITTEIPQVSFEDCIKQLKETRITKDHLCGGNRTVDACSGDSGGPLLTPVDGRWFSIGVVSWGIQCSHPVYPGVFTRILSYADWIEFYTRDSRFCNNKGPFTLRSFWSESC